MKSPCFRGKQLLHPIGIFSRTKLVGEIGKAKVTSWVTYNPPSLHLLLMASEDHLSYIWQQNSWISTVCLPSPFFPVQEMCPHSYPQKLPQINHMYKNWQFCHTFLWLGKLNKDRKLSVPIPVFNLLESSKKTVTKSPALLLLDHCCTSGRPPGTFSYWKAELLPLILCNNQTWVQSLGGRVKLVGCLLAP